MNFLSRLKIQYILVILVFTFIFNKLSIYLIYGHITVVDITSKANFSLITAYILAVCAFGPILEEFTHRYWLKGSNLFLKCAALSAFVIENIRFYYTFKNIFDVQVIADFEFNLRTNPVLNIFSLPLNIFRFYKIDFCTDLLIELGSHLDVFCYSLGIGAILYTGILALKKVQFIQGLNLSSWPFIIWTSIIFCYNHFTPDPRPTEVIVSLFLLTFSILILGFICALIRLKFGFWGAVAVHAIWNSLMSLFMDASAASTIVVASYFVFIILNLVFWLAVLIFNLRKLDTRTSRNFDNRCQISNFQ